MALNIIVCLSYIVSAGAMGIAYTIGVMSWLQLLASLLPYIAIYYFSDNQKTNAVYYNMLVTIALGAIGYVIAFGGMVTVQSISALTHLMLTSLMSIWFLTIGIKWIVSAVRSVLSKDKDKIRKVKKYQFYFLGVTICSELSTLILLIKQRPENLIMGGLGHMLMILFMYIAMSVCVRGKLDDTLR